MIRDTELCTTILEEMLAKMKEMHAIPPVRAAAPMLLLLVHNTMNRLLLKETFDQVMPEIRLPNDCVWIPRYGSDFVPIRFWIRDHSNGRKISGYFDPWSATGVVDGDAFWDLLSPDACDEHETSRVRHSNRNTLSEEIERMVADLRSCEDCTAALARNGTTDES